MAKNKKYSAMDAMQPMENGSINPAIFDKANSQENKAAKKEFAMEAIAVFDRMPEETRILIENWLAHYFMAGYQNIMRPIRKRGTDRLPKKTNKKAVSTGGLLDNMTTKELGVLKKALAQLEV